MLFRGWISSFGSKSATSPPNGASQPADARCGSGRTPLRRDDDRIPHRLAPDANRRDDAHPRDDNFSLSHCESNEIVTSEHKKTTEHGEHGGRKETRRRVTRRSVCHCSLHP